MWKVEVPSKSLKISAFDLWLPEMVADGMRDVKALIVLVPGSNGDGRYMVNEKDWKDFARKYDCGLIGCYFQDHDPNDIEGYCDAKVESGGNLLWAIREFSDMIKKPKLNQVPLLLWGFSAGGQFNYEFNAHFPERVGAFVVNKGGIYYTALVKERARRNPGLFFIGKEDARWRQDVVKGLYKLNYERGSAHLWDLKEEMTGHSMGASSILSKRFFIGVLEDYYPELIQEGKNEA